MGVEKKDGDVSDRHVVVRNLVTPKYQDEMQRQVCVIFFPRTIIHIFS